MDTDSTEKPPFPVSPTDSINLPKNIINALFKHTRSSPVNEVCGLIGKSKRGTITHYPVDNVSPTPEKRFEIAPKAQIDALKSMRKRREHLYAIYHSHPNGDVFPSSIDIVEAAYPEAFQIIVSVKDNIQKIRAFRFLSLDRVIEVTLDQPAHSPSSGNKR